MNDKFLSKKIYEKAKKLADEKYKRNSAYKSMYLMEKYEELGGKVISDKKSKLNNWRQENWVNLTGVALGKTKLKDAPVCGNKDKNQRKNKTICRPSVKVNKDTPKLASEFTQKQLKKALKIKNEGKRIDWSKL